MRPIKISDWTHADQAEWLTESITRLRARAAECDAERDTQTAYNFRRAADHMEVAIASGDPSAIYAWFTRAFDGKHV